MVCIAQCEMLFGHFCDWKQKALLIQPLGEPKSSRRGCHAIPLREQAASLFKIHCDHCICSSKGKSTAGREVTWTAGDLFSSVNCVPGAEHQQPSTGPSCIEYNFLVFSF